MMTSHRFLRRLLLLAACAAPLSFADATTLIWNTTTGTWDANTSANWNNGSVPVPWSTAGDTAFFQGVTGTVTVDDTHGQVGAAGIVATGGGALTIDGSALDLGAGGIADQLTNTLTISAPVDLTASQTWSATRSVANNSTSGFIMNGVISGDNNLTFDGRGVANPYLTGTGVTFQLGGASANTFVGTTTVTGGAVLRLDYTGGNFSRLDTSAALILAGGAVSLNGNSGGAQMVQTVGSTLVTMGANTILASGLNGGGGATNQIALGAISRNTGGTLDFTSTTIATTTQQNTNGILGGWATTSGTRWATNTGGVFGNTAGSGLAVGLWQATSNVNLSASTATTGNAALNALCITGANAVLTLADPSTLTITSGGIIAGATGQSIVGGSITSGMSTGELFIHAAQNFTVGSAIVDNGVVGSGGIAVALVKDGANTLTLSGANTYSGTTYVNAGKLAISSTGSLTKTGNIIVQGGATFDVTGYNTTNGSYTIGGGRILSGGGTVSGNIVLSSGGKIGPSFSYFDQANNMGNSHVVTGTLKFTNNLTLQDGSALTFNLGTNSDLLSLTGSAMTLTGSNSLGGITLNLFDAGGATVGNTYTLMQWAANDTLTSFDLTDFSVNGMTGTLAFSGNSLVFTVATVPEPSTLACIALGLVALTAVVRRNHVGKAAA